jgi:hypothetical protein
LKEKEASFTSPLLFLLFSPSSLPSSPSEKKERGRGREGVFIDNQRMNVGPVIIITVRRSAPLETFHDMLLMRLRIVKGLKGLKGLSLHVENNIMPISCCSGCVSWVSLGWLGVLSTT